MAKEVEAIRNARTASVLAPEFVEGLDTLGLEELRRRRDEALAEREYQSYLRRLVQVRQDLLVAERARRQAGEAPRPIVERLTAVLAEGPGRGKPRGEALRVQLPEEDIEEAERRAQSIAGVLDLAIPEGMDELLLDAAIEALSRKERAVSSDRSAVLRVHDLFQDELKRRFRQDPSLITKGR